MRLLGTVPAGTMKSSAVHFQPGDVLYGRLRPYLNKVFRPDFEGLASAEFIVFPHSEHFDNRYLQYFLNSAEFVSFATHLNTGDRPRVDYDQIAPYRIPLPPLPEQQRIVAAIEEQFTRLDAAVAGLKRTQANLKRYRAAVLAAACSGRLVPTEAELARQEGRDYEPADQLLQRILTERRERWEADQLTKMQAQGKVPKGDTWKTKYKVPSSPESVPVDLPEGWHVASIEQISTLVTDGDHNPPKRVPAGIPHLTAKHIKRWQITTNGCTHISLSDFERTRSRYEPLPGDLIVTCVGTVGETAIVPNGLTFSADRNLAGIRLVSDGVDVRYLQFTLNAPQWKKMMGQVSGSTAQPHLYLGDIRRLPIPVPPVAEQERIVLEVERLLSVVEELERSTEHALARAERLRQSILRRAFEGTLVPQDPTDEPAEVLLERIRAERATTTPNRRQRRTRALKSTQQPLFDLQEVGETE